MSKRLLGTIHLLTRLVSELSEENRELRRSLADDNRAHASMYPENVSLCDCPDIQEMDERYSDLQEYAARLEAVLNENPYHAFLQKEDYEVMLSLLLASATGEDDALRMINSLTASAVRQGSVERALRASGTDLRPTPENVRKTKMMFGMRPLAVGIGVMDRAGENSSTAESRQVSASGGTPTRDILAGISMRKMRRSTPLDE